MMKKNELTRKIIHIDMDAFFASVEQRDNPELRGLPVAVGGSGGRGVIAAASYEARKFGIRSAMPSHVAIRKCPMLYFVRPNFEKYKAVSAEIRAIFNRYTPIVEPLSLDEAYLDVTYSNYEIRSATLIAQQIKNDIKDELNLVASAGISYNKFLAKVASDEDKPDGLFVITPDEGPHFVQNLSIEKFFGVGKVTANKMKQNAIETGKDLLRFKKWELQQLFGKQGNFFYNISRGIDNREVKAERKRKSVGVENTFSEDIKGEIAINEAFTLIFEKWWQRYKNFGKLGKTITLKIRDKQFKTITRSSTMGNYITQKISIRSTLDELWHKSVPKDTEIRLIGITVSNFKDEEEWEERQLTIW